MQAVTFNEITVIRHKTDCCVLPVIEALKAMLVSPHLIKLLYLRLCQTCNSILGPQLFLSVCLTTALLAALF